MFDPGTPKGGLDPVKGFNDGARVRGHSAVE
jgi:hypothetical protein